MNFMGSKINCLKNEINMTRLTIDLNYIEDLNDTYFMKDYEPGTENVTTEKDVFMEWKPNKNSLKPQAIGIEQLGIQNELKQLGYNVYEEYTPHFDTYLKREYLQRLNQVVIMKSDESAKESSKKTYKFYALRPVEEYKGAMKDQNKLSTKHPKEFKIKTNPLKLSFGDVELCTKVTKELEIMNLNSKQNVGLNIQISEIISESSMVEISRDQEYPIIIHPETSFKLKVSVSPELVEPIKTVLILKTKNLYKIPIVVEFSGINNEYGIQPIVIEKGFLAPYVINFSIKNKAEDELNLELSEFNIVNNNTSLELFQIDRSAGAHSVQNSECNKLWNDSRCFVAIKDSIKEVKINPDISKILFYIKFEPKHPFLDLKVSFKLLNVDSGKESVIYLPIYIKITKNYAELYTYFLDFGVLFPNSEITYKMPIPARSLSKSAMIIGYPFVPLQCPFEFDFNTLLANNGIVSIKDSNLVGTVSLKTAGLADGEYTGRILFCRDKVCKNDTGKTKIHYKILIYKDPLNAKSKMHSFEIDKKAQAEKDKVHSMQFLWLKNTSDKVLKIQDVTCHDKELSIQAVRSKESSTISDDQKCCLSSIPVFLETCKPCKGTFNDSNTNATRLILIPNEENEDIKLKYVYLPNKSKTIEIKYVTVWIERSYIPIPVFIYDKTLACSFDSYTNHESNELPFLTRTSQ